MNRWPRLARWSLVVAVAANLSAAVGVLVIRGQDEATSLDVGSAVEEYRRMAALPATPSTAAEPAQQGATSGSTPAVQAATTTMSSLPAGTPQSDSGTVTSTTASTSPPAPSASRAPEPGVYVYDTSGYEEVDALGGARHDYPAETTITYTTSECGTVERWAPLTQRADSRLLCPAAAGDALQWFRTEREFFGQTVDFRFDCPANSIVRPTAPTPGEEFSFTCRSKNDDVSTATVTVHDPVPFTVGDQTITAVHVELRSTSQGNGQARTEVAMLLHPESGLVLSRTVATDAEARSAAGTSSYTERYTIRLRSLEPLR